MKYPVLPANSCATGPRPPQGRFADIVGHIHRMAGRSDPLDIVMVCAVEVGSQRMHLRTRPGETDRLELVAWLLHHGGLWAAVALEGAQAARRAA